MHEAGLAQQVIDTCAVELRAHGGRYATCVGLRIGALAAVDPDALRFCFDALKPGTPLEPATLDIQWLAVSDVGGDTTALDIRYLEFETEADA
jgi:hydrogenase nickel incorporation protein HypA/HybF